MNGTHWPILAPYTYVLFVKNMENITITKKIAKSGDNNIIVIPKFLKSVLKPKTVVRLDIQILDIEEDKENE